MIPVRRYNRKILPKLLALDCTIDRKLNGTTICQHSRFRLVIDQLLRRISNMALKSGFRVAFLLLVAENGIASIAAAATPTVQKALEVTPVQTDVDFDRPAADKLAACKVDAFPDQGGWAVYGDAGQMLRRFIDTNKDRKLDQWCYYKNGIEVYRDLDTNFNGKADQYRWLGTAGTRWGLDANEDGEIDSWKSISPEEVTAEVVAALRDQNATRFQRLLLTTEELAALGLSTKQAHDFRDRAAAAKKGFAEFQKQQKIIEKKSDWLQFGASRPGVIPAGTDGSTKDLLIYDNVAAIVDTDGRSGQLFVGTLVHVGGGWRTVDLPKTEAAGGTFVSLLNRPTSDLPGAAGINEKSQKLIDELQVIDQGLLKEGSDKAKLSADRASILEQLASAASESDRATWVKQYADTLSAGVQSGDYPAGLARLKAMFEKLKDDPASKELVPYVQFRYMTADYGQHIATAKETEYGKVQDQWLKDLEQFITAYPKTSETAEALLQLALGHEFSGSDEKAAIAYGRIASDFPEAEQSKKAAGAKLRLELVGKPLQLQGKSIDGQTFNLSQLRGKTVLVQYWATWCELCKQDMQQLKTLQAKYSQKGFVVVGVNLDNDVRVTNQYLADNRWPWVQLFESDGKESRGMDSRFANELGIMTLPTMILIDKNGKVVRRNIHAAELDAELGKLLK
jgi:thiol-disulfide isomerase/thioredoxin